MSTDAKPPPNAHGLCPDVPASTDRCDVVPISPRVGDRWALTGRYVEMVWSELLGPTATLLARRLGDSVDLHPHGVGVSLVEMGASLGLAPSKVRSSLLRLHRFGLSTMCVEPATIGVSGLAPSVSPALSARLSDGRGGSIGGGCFSEPMSESVWRRLRAVAARSGRSRRAGSRAVQSGRCEAVSGRRAGGPPSCRVARPAGSGVVGWRGSGFGCQAVSGLYTFAGSHSANLRSAAGLDRAGEDGRCLVRLTVTPIGSIGASSSAVAEAVVAYLEGEQGDPGAALLRAAGGATDYYADSVEGPGRWVGAGAVFQGLDGVLDRDAFRRVLEGRHPHTGARLVTARGSSQRQHLATGSAARFDEAGEALYNVSDVARLLTLRRRDVEELVEAGTTAHGDDDDPGWIGTVETDAGPMVPDREITRHLEIAARPVDADAAREAGEPDELLTVREVARLLHVTPRYVQRLCAAHDDRDDDGRRAAASLPSVRVGDGVAARYRVRRADVAAFAAARTPPVARVGFDLTLTCEKSLAVLSMLADSARQAVLLRALRVANATAVGHLDRVAAVARKRGAAVDTEGLVVASYFHATSRALDPHPHHHNVVANAVVDADGDVRTLDARALYRHAPAAAALATAAARWELRDLGLGWWRRDDGVWEIAGVDERAIGEFSRRRNEMNEVRAALEERLGRRITHGEETTVALSTRTGKQAVDPAELRADWQRRAASVGLDVAGCFDRRDGRAIVHDQLPHRQIGRLFADLVDPLRGLCAESVTFDRGDVLAAIGDWSIIDPPAMSAKWCSHRRRSNGSPMSSPAAISSPSSTRPCPAA